MRVLRGNIWLCTDCMLAAVNDDMTALDCDERAQCITSGLKALGPHLRPDFDVEGGAGYREFSRCGCGCCGSHLAGSFYRFVILTDK